VARYAALMRALPWSVSAHAKDIWTIPDWEKREKLAHASWAVTCTRAGAAHLAALAPGKVALVHHGIDLARFPPPDPDGIASSRDGSDPDHPVVLLSVGRAVAKKGYDDLLDALARLPPSLHWRFVHLGGGPLLDRLRRQAKRLGIAARIEWCGAATQPAVLAALRGADVFVLASRVARDGDRDGIPNVLVEAMSQRIAVLATAVASIPELVTDGLDGALVPPGDPATLALRLAALIAEPWARAALGEAAEERARRDFDFDRHVRHIVRRFESFAAAPEPDAIPTSRAAE
jgi:glycosyltransferase involved in cell wall biosynthesis